MKGERQTLRAMKNITWIFKRDLKRLFTNWVAVIVVIGVCIIPSLYAWFNIAANMTLTATRRESASLWPAVTWARTMN